MVVRSLRANVTAGPEPGGPGGGWGRADRVAVIPGVMLGVVPKISVWIRAGSRPSWVSAAVSSVRNDVGPHT